MSTLAFHFKQLYQCRRVWWFYIFFLADSLLFLGFALKQGRSGPPLGGIFCMLFFFAHGAGSLIADTWNKPFSFCLPGLRQASRKLLVILWLAVLTAHIPGLAYLAFKGPGLGNLLFVSGLGGFISLVFWLGIYLSIGRTRLLVNIFSVAAIIYTSIWQENLNAVLLTHPVAIVLFSGMLSYAIYRSVTTAESLRNVCENPRYGLIHWSTQRKIRYAKMRRAHGAPPAPVSEPAADLFTRLTAPCSSALSHICSGIYIFLGPLRDWWKPTLAVALLLPLWGGFVGGLPKTGGGADNQFFFLFLMLFLFLWFKNALDPKPDHLFLLTSRRHLFLKRIAGSVSVISAIFLFFGYLVSMTHILSLLPAVTLMGRPYQVIPIDWELLLLPFMIWPLFEGLSVLLRKNIPVLIIAFIAAMLPLVAVDLFFHYRLAELPVVHQLEAVITLAAIPWVFLVGATYYNCRRRSLC